MAIRTKSQLYATYPLLKMQMVFRLSSPKTGASGYDSAVYLLVSSWGSVSTMTDVVNLFTK